jgi:hypothetical protein
MCLPELLNQKNKIKNNRRQRIMKIINSSSSSGGIGFVGLLTIVFIVLKLIGKISWEWIWVLSPLWISMCTVVITISIILILSFVVWSKL